MKCYIDFYYDNNNELVAEIHKQGKHKTVTYKRHVNKLIEIAEKHGYKINGECRIEDRVITITQEFDRYMHKQRNKLRILGNITDDLILSRIDPTTKKKIAVGTLVAALTIGTGIGISQTMSNTETTITTETETVNDDIETTTIAEDIKIEEVENNSDLDELLNESSFHYSYEDRSNDNKINNCKRYEDIFEKYAHMYGLDKNLLMALSAQESSGDHYNNLYNGPACGIMQIEKQVHIGTNTSAYNFNTNNMETITITEDSLNNLDTNIKIGAMLLRQSIEKYNYNIPLALQTYNFGQGNMNKVLDTCSQQENISVEEMTNTPTYNNWLNYRNFLNIGDPEYVEHVFSFLGNKETITVLDRNSKQIKIKLINDYEKGKHY